MGYWFELWLPWLLSMPEKAWLHVPFFKFLIMGWFQVDSLLFSTHLKQRIWTYDSSTPASRNATIYCGAKIMSLDWECKSDRLVCKLAFMSDCIYGLILNDVDYLRSKFILLSCGSFWQKLLIGTADGGIKAWNVDAKRVVCDLSTTEAFPRFILYIHTMAALLLFLGVCS